LDVDLARRLGQKLGLEVRFVPTLSFDGLYDALTADQVDVIISAVVIDPGRTADYAYSIPYFDAGQVLLVRPEQAGAIEEMQDLAERGLAVELGSEGDRVARYWDRRLRGLDLTHYDTLETALAAVTAGQADAALTDRASALMNCAQHGLRLSGQTITDEQYAAVVLKEHQSLLDATNDALIELDTEGELDHLVETWLCAEESCCGH
jgi:polar amino acid transport system substrate-binding protein